MSRSASRQLVVCVKNEGYPASLEKRKIYVALPDPVADMHGKLRVIVESGEDYISPTRFFIPVTLPQSARKAILTAA
jgi:hypothetical protein